jgi:eukaryotic-like serine/threonine-protein kinase
MPSNSINDIDVIRSHFSLRYHISEKAGVGGMSVVYRAKHKLTGRVVALKILKPELYTDNNIVDRFYQEVRIGATLNHPNLLKIFYGENFNGLHFLEMEYLKGISLYSFIHRKGKLTEQKTLRLILPIISALSYLHSRTIIHRDIKSPNIFITSQKRPVLMDFGVAWQHDGQLANNPDKLVTVEYSSPEDLSVFFSLIPAVTFTVQVWLCLNACQAAYPLNETQ